MVEKLAMNRIFSVLMLVVAMAAAAGLANPAAMAIAVVPGDRVSGIRPAVRLADSMQAAGVTPTKPSLLPTTAGDDLDPAAAEDDLTSQFNADMRQTFVYRAATLNSQREAWIVVSRSRLRPSRGP